jgi:hypothetical protein
MTISKRYYADAVRDLKHRIKRVHGKDSVFVESMTTAVLSEVFRKRYEAHKFVGGGLMPLDTSADAGALAVAWDDAGATTDQGDGFVADTATDIPTEDVNLERRSNPAHTIARAYTYSDTMIDTARMGNYDPIVDKADRAREAWERNLNDAIRFGSPAKNVPGFYRHPDISVTPANTGNWATATAAQIVQDFSSAVDNIMQRTDGVGAPTAAIFDIPTWRLIETLQNSVASDISVLEYLQRTHRSITTWTWDAGLLGQGDGGTGEGRNYTGGSNCCMIYRNDRQTLRGLLPKGMTPKGPQEDGLAYKTIFWGRYAGLAIPRPLEVVRLEGL